VLADGLITNHFSERWAAIGFGGPGTPGCLIKALFEEILLE